MRYTKLAGLMPVQNYQNFYGSFHMLEALCDWTCILDDNSRTPFQFAEDADEYLTLRRGTLWHDVGNRTMLMYRAYLAGYHWAIVMDCDLVPSLALFKAIKNLNLSGYAEHHVYVPLRDVWDNQSQYQYRTDGIWGEKNYPILQYVPFATGVYCVRQPGIRLHTPPLWPAKAAVHLNPFPGDCCIYHFGSLTGLDREARVQKYRREDGKHEFQADYSYLADERNATFAPIPEEDSKFISDWLVHRKLPELP